MLDMLDPGWGDTWSCQSPNSAGTACDFTGTLQAMERRTTVKDLLQMKRQGLFCSGYQPEDPPAPSHNSPEHMDPVSLAHPIIAPSNPSPQHMDLSPTQPVSNPPTAPLNLPCQLQLTSPAPYSPPHLTSALNRSPPANPNLPTHLCSASGAHPSTLPQLWDCAEGPITTLFQWQVQQLLDKTKGLSPELINLQDSDGDTPLHIAVAQGKRALAYVLAANMALSGTLDLPEHNGQTALHIAAATDQPLMVGDLVEYGAQVYRRDIWGRSPLHVCVEKGHIHSLHSMFRTLKAIGKDFDVDLVNYDGLTPLHMAVLAHNATLREESALQKSYSVKERELLLKKGLNFIECVKALLQMGASCGAQDQKSGRTSVHMAAEEANTQLLNLLLSKANTLNVVNLRTFSGNTALHIACALQSCRGQLEAVQMLMRSGADPGVRNYENELPCQLLPEGKSAEKVRQVLKGRYFDM